MNALSLDRGPSTGGPAASRQVASSAATGRATAPADVTVAAVASLALRASITGPPRPVRELARFSQALYLVVDDSATTNSAVASRALRAPVIALLAPGAVAVPGGLQLTTELSRWPSAPAIGLVGDGRLAIDGALIVVRRWWDPVPRLRSTTPQALRECAARVARRLTADSGADSRADSGADSRADSRADLGAGFVVALDDDSGTGLLASLELVLAALANADDVAAARAADAMIGLGPGLTPRGDDLLAGLLASIRPLQAAIAAGRRGADRADADIVRAAHRLADTVAQRADGRTTTVSAELLGHAANGAVAQPVLVLLQALTGRGAVDPAATALLDVGSSSGRDLTVGVLAAVDLLAGGRTRHLAGGRTRHLAGGRTRHLAGGRTRHLAGDPTSPATGDPGNDPIGVLSRSATRTFPRGS